jgi:hypothetical protein
MLGQVIGTYWLPLVRDVLAMGYRADDILTTLSVAEMVAIVAAAPPSSSLQHYMNGGWSQTDQLLANMQEQNAGLAHMEQPYVRPGLESRPVDPNKMFNADSYTWDEFTELEEKRAAWHAEQTEKGIAPKNTRVKVW